MPNEPSEADGIKAIIALQALVGITETETEAKRGWRGMTVYEKANTMAAYKFLFETPKGQWLRQR